MCYNFGIKCGKFEKCRKIFQLYFELLLTKVQVCARIMMKSRKKELKLWQLLIKKVFKRY